MRFVFKSYNAKVADHFGVHGFFASLQAAIVK
jgi:hypothetical protein